MNISKLSLLFSFSNLMIDLKSMFTTNLKVNAILIKNKTYIFI